MQVRDICCRMDCVELTLHSLGTNPMVVLINHDMFMEDACMLPYDILYLPCG
jgi:hypothetical protein